MTAGGAHTAGHGGAPRLTPRVGDLAGELSSMLGAAGIVDAAAEARDLIAAVAGESRFWPRVNADAAISDRLADRARAVARRRAQGMPFAYAVGRAAFRHLALRVDERVLIPRQETEELVDIVLRERRVPGGVVADVGTGSGAIAIALAAEGAFDRVIATDVARDAIDLARENAAALDTAGATSVEFRVGDLLAPLAGERLDILVSNPPYIAFDEAVELPPLVRDWEPVHALLSPGHGLDHTRRLVAGAPALLCIGGLLALEVDSRRALQVAELVAASGAFTGIQVYRDLSGRDRFVTATRAALATR